MKDLAFGNSIEQNREQAFDEETVNWSTVKTLTWPFSYRQSSGYSFVFKFDTSLFLEAIQITSDVQPLRWNL